MNIMEPRINCKKHFSVSIEEMIKMIIEFVDVHQLELGVHHYDIVIGMMEFDLKWIMMMIMEFDMLMLTLIIN